ncbi:hypothetical protein GCM10023318_33910 [Nocardia callitridis]|uniref:HTH lysR-type domain-containing protein n=1 Tax=Nocardia callitridis TaxID=648753 RepID=A0ABP9KDG1_9NOCA
MESIEVTRLRWFVAVAEELHFARAAKSVGITRQRLSHAVRDLEAELGTKLFVPGAHPTELTDDGAALLAAARERIVEVPPVESDTTQRTLRVGFVPGVTVAKWTRIWAERFQDTPLEVIAVAQAEQETALRAGRVDMCFVRLPIERVGMNAIPLYRELPVVVVAKEHPISVFDEVVSADLAQEIQQDGTDIDEVSGAIELVAAGVGVVVVPHSIARLHARRDLVYRTVTDLEPTDIALAWPTDSTDDLVEEFIGVVRGRSARSSRSESSTNVAAQKKPAQSVRAKPSKPAKKPAAKKPAGKKPVRRRSR